MKKKYPLVGDFASLEAEVSATMVVASDVVVVVGSVVADSVAASKVVSAFAVVSIGDGFVVSGSFGAGVKVENEIEILVGYRKEAGNEKEKLPHQTEYQGKTNKKPRDRCKRANGIREREIHSK